MKPNTLKSTARLAGLLYLLLAISGFFSIMYVPSQTIVRGDPVATANHILANEFLYRAGIAIHLISVTGFLFLVFVLYKLLKHVNAHRARLMVALVVVQVPIVFVLETCKIVALRLLKDEGLHAFTSEQLQVITTIFLKMHGSGILTVELFWGLWLLPFGLLVYRSGFIPRIFGILLIFPGIGYVVDSLTCILFPAYREYTMWPAFVFSAVGEFSIIFWFLIKGVKESRSE